MSQIQWAAEDQGRRQVRRARFIKNGCLLGSEEHREGNAVIGSKDNIEAEYGKGGFALGIQANAQKG